jgi:predicted secreted protein
MKSLKFALPAAACFSLAAVFLFAVIVPLGAVGAVTASPFAALAGRWTGEGMLGYKASPPERVKCRATYILTDAQDELKQTIRCATSGGAIEVISNVKEAAGKLSGHWKETMHNFEGDLDGEVTPRGFHIIVHSSDLSANMDIAVRNNKQAIEIQFASTTLLGLSLIMTKG